MNPVNAQKLDKISGHFNLGNYPVGIAKPTFNQLHTGIQLGLVHKYNNSKNHNINQSLSLGFIHHADFQNAVMLSTELFYRYTSGIGISISPLVLGGGYTYSVLDQQTFIWSNEEQSYVKDNWPDEHNWHIILGSSLGYQFGKDKRYRVTADYRLMVQGIIVTNTVPVVLYTPLRLGLEFPISFK